MFYIEETWEKSKKITTGVFEGLHNHKSLNSENYCDVFLVATCHKFSTISKLKYKGNIMFYYFQWSIPLNHQFDHHRGCRELVAEDEYRAPQFAIQANAREYFCFCCAACYESHTPDVKQKLLVLQNLQKCWFGFNQ